MQIKILFLKTINTILELFLIIREKIEDKNSKEIACSYLVKQFPNVNVQSHNFTQS